MSKNESCNDWWSDRAAESREAVCNSLNPAKLVQRIPVAHGVGCGGKCGSFAKPNQETRGHQRRKTPHQAGCYRCDSYAGRANCQNGSGSKSPREPASASLSDHVG